MGIRNCKMKIAIIGPVYPYRGGIAQFTTQLSEHLSKRNHDVKIISFRRQYPKWLYPGQSDLDPSQKAQPDNANYLLDALNPLTWFKAYDFISRYKPEIVLFQWWTTYWGPTNIVLNWLCNKGNYPVTYIIHNVYPHEGKQLDRWITKTTLKLGRSFIALSRREQNKLSLLLPARYIHLSPLPVFEKNTQTLPGKEIARKQLGVPPRDFVALFFGIVRPYKGLNILLQSIADLKDQKQNVHLIIAGEIWGEKHQYQALIEQLNIRSNVTIHDKYIPDHMVPMYFSAADVFIAPYISGSQSASLRTALSYGLPIVASDAIYDEELFNQLKNYPIFIFPSGNIKQLTQSIIKSMKTKIYTRPINTLWEQLVETIENSIL